MPIKRLTVVGALAAVLLVSAPVYASNTPSSSTPSTALSSAMRIVDSFAISDVTTNLVPQMASLSPLPMRAQSVVPGDANSLLTADVATADSDSNDGAASDTVAPEVGGGESITDLRKALLAVAMSLRDVRYVRGGHDPSTGFDCSGFVRYVFSHAIGLQLPSNSASQFLAGLKVRRADMKPGDLVFFRTQGRHRISHVGIYISNGRFIHSPTTGKSVEISSLDNSYWAKRFAGAKRPEAMELAARKG